jgi:hypothetical protein
MTGTIWDCSPLIEEKACDPIGKLCLICVCIAGNENLTAERVDSDERRGDSGSDRQVEALTKSLPEYEEQVRRWTVHLEPQDWQGKSFLNVDCGMGRNSFRPLTYGARAGCAVDID